MLSLKTAKAHKEYEKSIEWLLEKTKLKVLNKKDVIQMFGQRFDIIDHMFFSPDINSYVVVRNNVGNVRHIDVTSFLDLLNVFAEKIKHFYIIGIFITCQDITPILKAITFNPIDNGIFQNVFGETIPKVLEKLHEYLHNHQIYFYDDDMNCLMKNDYVF